MKTYLLKPMVVVCLCLLTASFTFAADNYKMVKVKAPFPMQPIKVFIYPDKDFLITDYGAKNGGKVNNTKAIAAAIEACHKSGGGRVVVPAGIWLTGPIHFKSNVNLYLEENAILNFTDNPSDYLPAVMTSWEGLECYNYSPLLYAFECENVAITGKGTLQPKMDTWKVWFKRPQPHLEALKELYTKASTNIPVIERQMAIGENHLRPHLIHFNRCKNVLLDGFKIRESPFWTIHLYMCDGGLVRNLDVKAHGHNNDGIDFEMSRNFLVEDFKKNEKHINSIYHETTFSKYCYRIYLHTDRSGTKSLFQFIRQMEFPDRPGRYRRQGTMVQKIPRRFYQPTRLHARKCERR